LDVGAEGEEARVAFDHLLGRDYEGMDELWELDWHWVACRKMARHLSLEPPGRRSADVRAFITSNVDSNDGHRENWREM
jgi:hypothetical protein